MKETAGGGGALSGKERRLVVLLGIPSAGLSVCLTVLSTYVPVLARRFTSSTTVIGMLVGGEGLIAVLIPIWVGRLSDRTDTRLGRRLPFLIATAPVAALALGLVPFAPSLAVMAVAVFFFYLAYFSYFAPYQAIYPDLVSDAASGRAQGIQGGFTQLGLGAALVGGAFLIDVWRPLPYLLAAATLLLTTLLLVFGLGASRARRATTKSPVRSPEADVWTLLRDNRGIRSFVVGNALLTLGLGGLKSFVVLWLTEGLGKTMRFTAFAMTVVAVGATLGALVSGKLADRYGITRVFSIALTLFGVGLALGTFSTSTIVLGAAFPAIALAAGAAVALPYALLMRLMPSGSHGTMAGLYDVSSGVGTLLGAAVTGAAIDLMHPWFASTGGYAAMWPVLSLSILGSVVVLRGVGAIGPARPGS